MFDLQLIGAILCSVWRYTFPDGIPWHLSYEDLTEYRLHEGLKKPNRTMKRSRWYLQSIYEEYVTDYLMQYVRTTILPYFRLHRNKALYAVL